MTEIVSKQVSNCDVPELIKKLLPDSIASDITKAAMPIYPVENCYVSKIKVIKKLLPDSIASDITKAAMPIY